VADHKPGHRQRVARLSDDARNSRENSAEEPRTLLELCMPVVQQVKEKWYERLKFVSVVGSVKQKVKTVAFVYLLTE